MTETETPPDTAPADAEPEGGVQINGADNREVLVSLATAYRAGADLQPAG